jgi:hypothetical protein
MWYAWKTRKERTLNFDASAFTSELSMYISFFAALVIFIVSLCLITMLTRRRRGR